MGNCKSWVHKQREPSRDLTLAILGLDNAGKTVTAKGLQGDSLDSVAPTVGFSSIEFKFEKHKITLFDLGGGKRIRDIWKNYFSEVYGVVYVVDSSEPERLVECKGVLKNLLQHAKVAGKPVLVLANKQDVQGALDEIDICEYLDLEETVNMNKCPCRVETCSAILGQGKKLDKPIKDGFSWLVGIITSNFEKLDARIRKDVEEMKEKAAQDKKERAERVRKQKEERYEDLSVLTSGCS
ncbi:hypothetical protein CAPTEDRAFT_184387 [Capitella teleta]|uniref:ADP-ribosylation factor-like protein 13B n=1 Tax=Capitella teleta TaxID=283909 RepID=R7VC63_CAPTE|nr:hypothetical protein CAPTEDRAFT_184387 [Capitella teleta]|eukprot:ELU13265.1 hypothetical protein CAPTEDRAFT_184387 [Capitella teleta]